MAHGGQPRINNLRQGPILVRDFVTHVACMLQKCRNAGSRNERHAPLTQTCKDFALPLLPVNPSSFPHPNREWVTPVPGFPPIQLLSNFRTRSFYKDFGAYRLESFARRGVFSFITFFTATRHDKPHKVGLTAAAVDQGFVCFFRTLC